MDGSLVRAALGAVLTALAATACGELPTFVEQEPDIAVLRLQGCGVVVTGETCEYNATAVDRQGNPIARPEVFWSLSNGIVASLTSNGPSAILLGRQAGSTTLRVRNATGSATDEIDVRVLQGEEPPPGL